MEGLEIIPLVKCSRDFHMRERENPVATEIT